MKKPNAKKIDPRYLHCIVMLRATQIAQRFGRQSTDLTHMSIPCFLCALRGERRGDEQRTANFKAAE